MMQLCIKNAANGKDLTREEAECAMDEIMSGSYPVQIAALITALRMKGELSTK